MDNFLIKFKTSGQISPDDFDVWFEEKIFNENTTLKQIKEWYKTKMSNCERVHQLFLSEPDQ